MRSIAEPIRHGSGATCRPSTEAEPSVMRRRSLHFNSFHFRWYAWPNCEVATASALTTDDRATLATVY